MKFIFFLLLLGVSVFGDLIKTKLISVDGDSAKIKVDRIDVGVSGFVVKQLAENRSSIINGVSVIAFDPQLGEATLELRPFTVFVNNNLPKGKWKAQKGDLVVLAFGYNRGLLIAPSEKTYFTLSRAIQGENFIHPDVFATMLSFQGHPTPLQKDFTNFCNNVSIGLLFFYIEKNLYTVDCHSFKILNIQKAPLEQEMTQLPFYSRVKEIEANWYGEGSDELQSYEAYYYKLLLRNNVKNEQLIRNIETSQNPAVDSVKQMIDQKGVK